MKKVDAVNWPENFPDIATMYDLLHKMAQSSWRNESTFNKDVITKWLDNFTGLVYSADIEKRLVLWLLCNFTFYNEDELRHLCNVVFKRFLHRIALDYNIQKDENLHHLLDNVYFTSMGSASESGGLLLYYFRQQADLSIDKFYYPVALPKNEDGIIVFIDDVTLSGHSAKSFFKANLAAMKYKHAYYLTLFASQRAIGEIEKFKIRMIQSTILSDRERCFTNDSLIFSAFPELRKPAEKVARAYGRKIFPRNPLGHKNGQYCFGLYYNTPNNTLPIFWSFKDWEPVFPRKEKRRNDRHNREYDRFI